jgi:hypothetical protein
MRSRPQRPPAALRSRDPRRSGPRLNPVAIGPGTALRARAKLPVGLGPERGSEVLNSSQDQRCIGLAVQGTGWGSSRPTSRRSRQATQAWRAALEDHLLRPDRTAEPGAAARRTELPTRAAASTGVLHWVRSGLLLRRENCKNCPTMAAFRHRYLPIASVAISHRALSFVRITDEIQVEIRRHSARSTLGIDPSDKHNMYRTPPARVRGLNEHGRFSDPELFLPWIPYCEAENKQTANRKPHPRRNAGRSADLRYCRQAERYAPRTGQEGERTDDDQARASRVAKHLPILTAWRPTVRQGQNRTSAQISSSRVRQSGSRVTCTTTLGTSLSPA